MSVDNATEKRLRALFEKVIAISNSVYFCEVDGVWRKYTLKEGLVESVVYKSVRYIKREEVVLAHIDDLTSEVIDTNGEIIYKLKTPGMQVLNVVNGMLYVNQNNLKGILSRDYGIVVPFINYNIRFYEKSPYIVLEQMDGEKLADYNGRILINGIFDSLAPLKNGQVLGIIDKSNYVLDPINGPDMKYRVKNIKQIKALKKCNEIQ